MTDNKMQPNADNPSEQEKLKQVGRQVRPGQEDLAMVTQQSQTDEDDQPDQYPTPYRRPLFRH